MSRKKTLDSKRLQKDQDKENNSSSSSNEISSKVEQSARTAISTKAMVRTTDDPNGASKIYSLPALYDMAFGYRNFESEVDFLVYAHQLHSSPDEKTGPYSILELAAGPARHSLTALINHDCPITHCHAIDLSSDMATYSQELALELVKDEMTRSSFAYSIMNMCNLNPFSLLQKHPENAHHDTDITNNEKSPCPLPPSLQLYDSAWLLLGSMQHILTNKEAISTFQSIASVVHTGGTLIVELPHPRELFRLMECTRNGWEIPLEGEDGKEEGELRIVWGDDDDRFDPILQQRDFTVELTLVETETATTSSSSKKKHKEVITQHVKEVVPMRLFTAQELDILATASGCWKLEKMYGALDEEVLIENDDLAFRMVCVFQRV